MSISYVQLSQNSDYSKFSAFDCSYSGVPDHAKEEVHSLSRYLSDEEGAKSDLRKGLGVTTVAYVDEEVAGYFTLMTGSVLESRTGADFTDRFPFYCITYPAIKISRFAVDRKYQSMEIEPGLKVSDYMFIEILSIGESLARVEAESRYGAAVPPGEQARYDERQERLGVRFVIADALGAKRTLNFYCNRGFKPFKSGEIDYPTMIKDIVSGTYRKPENVKHVGIPLYLDLQKKLAKV